MIRFHVKHCCQQTSHITIAQASRLQNTYTIYSYKNEQISIIFSQEGELLYVTPDPDYLYFK
ncbi:DUF4947 domain-containing protein [Streptococcus sanguinis]|uniref:DUF4947 domain-containing protein n=1 Tax=Streptococcus sanguinis TaxID=1305 RepID=UPI00210B2412|nr:DUF4947 domain-containing protein [Streptococcus sanguinis]